MMAMQITIQINLLGIKTVMINYQRSTKKILAVVKKQKLQKKQGKNLNKKILCKIMLYLIKCLKRLSKMKKILKLDFTLINKWSMMPKISIMIINNVLSQKNNLQKICKNKQMYNNLLLIIMMIMNLNSMKSMQMSIQCKMKK